MEFFIFGPTKTLSVDGSVGLLAEDMRPTSGKYAGMQAERVLIQAIGGIYLEAGGGDATSNAFPMAAGDELTIDGYENIKNLRFIKSAGATTIVWIPGYR